jgi:hypothetical protein
VIALGHEAGQILAVKPILAPDQGTTSSRASVFDHGGRSGLRALPLDARAAIEMAPPVAHLMAAELGRDAAWEKQQVSDFRKLALTYLFK